MCVCVCVLKRPLLLHMMQRPERENGTEEPQSTAWIRCLVMCFVQEILWSFYKVEWNILSKSHLMSQHSIFNCI